MCQTSLIHPLFTIPFHKHNHLAMQTLLRHQKQLHIYSVQSTEFHDPNHISHKTLSISEFQVGRIFVCSQRQRQTQRLGPVVLIQYKSGYRLINNLKNKFPKRLTLTHCKILQMQNRKSVQVTCIALAFLYLTEVLYPQEVPIFLPFWREQNCFKTGHH